MSRLTACTVWLNASIASRSRTVSMFITVAVMPSAENTRIGPTISTLR